MMRAWGVVKKKEGTLDRIAVREEGVFVGSW